MDGTVIICVAWDDCDGGVPGSQIRWCAFCGTEITVSPDGLTLVDGGVAKPACVDCGIGLTDMDPPDEMYQRVDGRDVAIPGDAARAAMRLIQRD
jgi:hypothetical protein